MRSFILLGLMPLGLAAADPSPLSQLWTDLQAKREALTGFQQQFNVTRTYRLANGSAQASKSVNILDGASNRWREKVTSGSGVFLRLYDSADLFFIQEDSGEFIRAKRRQKDGPSLPDPCITTGIDWAKAKEVERRPCGLAGKDHPCIVIDAPLKSASEVHSGRMVRTLPGQTRLLVDLDTGLPRRTSIPDPRAVSACSMCGARGPSRST